MCAEKLDRSEIKRKRVFIHESAAAVEEDMTPLTDSDDDSVILSWTEGHSSAARGDPQVKRGVTGTGVSAEKLLIQMVKEIGAIQKQVC